MGLLRRQVQSGILMLSLGVIGVSGVSGTRMLAQSSRGSMGGTITDNTGAVVPNATITLLNTGNGGQSSTVSSSAGVFRFPELPLGTYTVTITAKGFQKQVSNGVQVTVNSTSALNVTLQPGAVTEIVTVDASAPSLDTETSEIGGTVSNKQVEDLPLSLANGVGGMRSPETFTFLLPGTTGPGTGTNGNTGNGVFFARLGGGQAYGNEVLLDGASIQRSENGSSFDETSPSIEALQEFKVTTATPSAEFGRTTAGVESFSIKSGTNNFHGIGFTIVKNAVFDANSWFNNGYLALNCGSNQNATCPQYAAYKRLQDSKYDYGGDFTGPVYIPKLYNGRDKTFFLFSWEKYALKLGGTSQSTLPTAAERNGDFSDVLNGQAPVGNTNYPGYSTPVFINPCTGTPILYNQVHDPTTSRSVAANVFCRTPLAGNKIPTQYMSSVAKSLINGLPLPNQAPQTTDSYGFINNYSYASVQPIDNTSYTIRVDQNFGQKSKIFASYATRQNFKLTGAANLPGQFNSNGYVQTFTTHYSRAGWDYNITPNVLNHLNLGYNRTNSVNLSANFGSTNTAASNGLAGDFSAFFPVIAFPSPDQPTTLGQQQNGQNIDNGIRINDSVNWLRGRNSFKFGVDVRFQQYSVINYNQDTLNFYRDQTAAQNDLCCYSGNPVASFLMGEVGTGSQNVFNIHPRWNSHYIAGFVQDDVKLTKNLTVNLGLRYDVDVPRKEAENRTSEFSFTAPDAAAGGLPGALVFGTTCSNCNTRWADTWYKDISPRVGFAYVLPGTDNKLVLRGGAAILYGPLQYSDFGGSMTFGYNQSRSFNIGDSATTGGAFTPAFRLDTNSAPDPTNPSVGFTNVSYAPNLDPTQLTSTNGPGTFNAIAGLVIQPKFGRPAMTNNFSLQLQYEIAPDLIATAAWTGQVSQNLHSGFLSNINNIDTKYFSLGDELSNNAYRIPAGGTVNGVKAPYSTFTAPLGQALRPFPQYDYIAGDCCLENLGHSSYNAALLSLARRFRNGFNLQVSYTWSKLLTDADSTIPFSYVSSGELEQAAGSGNLKLDKAVSAQNTPQQVSISYLYQLPFGKGRKWVNDNRALDALIGGWQIGGIQRYQSGEPVSFGCASGIPYYQNCINYTAGPASKGATDFASDAYKTDANHASYFNGKSWFKPAYRPAGTINSADPGVPMSQAAFIDQNREGNGWLRSYDQTTGHCVPVGQCSLVPYSLGNLPRVTSAFQGPRYLAEDISILKEFHLYQRLTFQLKGEAFDVLNRHRMGLPDASPGDVNVNTGANNSLGFGVPTYTDYGPRTMQVTGKIIF